MKNVRHALNCLNTLAEAESVDMIAAYAELGAVDGDGRTCEIINDTMAWRMLVDGRDIIITGADQAEYFGDKYKAMGYDVKWDKDKWKREQLEKEIEVCRNNVSKMSHEEMCRIYRFARSGSPYFDSTKPFNAIFMARFNAFGGMTPEMSKKIGW